MLCCRLSALQSIEKELERQLIVRQRRIKNLFEKIEKYSDIVIPDVKNIRGKWNDAFGNFNPVFAEIGSGKGRFIKEMAERNPDCNFIAIEGQVKVVYHLLKTIHGHGGINDGDLESVLEKEIPVPPSNILVIDSYIRDLCDIFDQGELAGIYLNFSDPWPKARHEKRRLTNPKFLKQYMQILPIGGFLEFKTDDVQFFEYSIDGMQALKNFLGYEIVIIERDLHNSAHAFGRSLTEYEAKFKRFNKPINLVRLEKVKEMVL